MKRLLPLMVLFLQVTFLFATAQSAVNDSLFRIIQENKQDLAENRALNALASNLTRIDMQRAEFYLCRSMELATKLNSPKQLSYAYGQMVTVQLNMGRTDSAQYYLALLKKLSEQTGLILTKSNYNFAAGLFYKILGNSKAALPYMKEALNYMAMMAKDSPTIENKVALAGQYLNVGNAYTVLGGYKNALQYHLTALQLFEELNNRRGISFCYQNIGRDFLELSQYNLALSYTRKSIDIKTEQNDKRGVATSLEQEGAVYLGLKQYDTALGYYFNSLKIIQEMKLKPEEGHLDNTIGQAYGLKKDLANATLYYQNSKLLAQQIGDSSEAAAADAALIKLQSTVNKERQNEKKLISSLHTSIETGDKNSELLNYQYLSDHYASNRQFDKALEYANKYHLVNDSMQNVELQLQMKRMEEQYNLDKKESEIKLLKKDQELTHLSLQKQKANQFAVFVLMALLLLIGFLIVNRYRIVQKTRRILEMEKMRNSIARDLHDDIGSTLSSINVLSDVTLQSQQMQEPIRSNMQKIKDRSSSIMESMDDIVWAINPQNDTMEQLLFRMEEFAAELLEPLHMNYSFKGNGQLSLIKLDIKQRKDFYMLFKEALNNAAKYSRCNNIQVVFAQVQHKLRLEIVDDGIGFEKEKIKNGNGLNNMQERAASMGAKILIDSNIGKGTRITLDLNTT